MARNGKIARMPLDIRNELNRRLQDGEPGVKLVAWLNGVEVDDRLEEHGLEGVRITEQNLSEWRAGGYQDWLRHEEARQFMEDMAEQAGELEMAADGKSISDRFGALLAVDMARLAQKFLEQERDMEKRWEKLKEISKELSRLRRDEHRAVWTWIRREKWERQRERDDVDDEENAIRREEEKEREMSEWAMSTMPELAKRFGGGPEAVEKAAAMMETAKGLEPGDLTGFMWAVKDALKQSKETPVKKSVPDGRPQTGQNREAEVPVKASASDTGNMAVPGMLLTEGHQKSGQSDVARKDARLRQASARQEEGEGIQVNPTKSDQIQPKSDTGIKIKVERAGFSVEGPDRTDRTNRTDGADERGQRGDGVTNSS